MEHIPAPEPVDAPVRQRDTRAVTLAKLQAPGLELAAYQGSGTLDALLLRLDADHATRAPDGFRQPEGVEPHAATHIEAA